MVEGFSRFLKDGKRDYYKILRYHFLAGIANSPEFRDVTHWCIFPSSGTELNPDMMEFKESVRCLMGSRIPKTLQGSDKNNLLLRVHSVQKSHRTNASERIRNGASKHFESIIINPEYNDKKWNVKDKVVCVLDDYLTHGNSFESARNLLKAAGAKKVICVSLGTFKNIYRYQEYKLSGDFYHVNGFEYEKLSSCTKSGKFDEEARTEVRKLYDIFNEM